MHEIKKHPSENKYKIINFYYVRFIQNALIIYLIMNRTEIKIVTIMYYA